MHGPPPAAQRWAPATAPGRGNNAMEGKVRHPKCKCRLFTLSTWRRNDYLLRRRRRRITRRLIGRRGREAAIHLRTLDLEVCQAPNWENRRFEESTEIGKKTWLFAKLQTGRAGKRINASPVHGLLLSKTRQRLGKGQYI